MDNGQLTIIRVTDVTGFEMRWINNPPISETVGNGLCAVPGALQLLPVQMNGTTPVGAAILPPATFRISPVRLNGITQYTVHPM